MKLLSLQLGLVYHLVTGDGIPPPPGMDIDGDSNHDGWTDGASNNWFCSATDVNSYQSQISIEQAPSIFPNFIINGGVGYNPSALSKVGSDQPCCGSGSIVNTATQICECPSSSVQSIYYSSDSSTTFTESDQVCVDCASIVASSETFNEIEISHFLTSSSSSSCSFNPFIGPTGTGTEFRCSSTLTSGSSGTAIYSALKCPDPSDQTACLR